MTRARDLADSADKDIVGTLTLDDLSVEGSITVTGTVDSRDINTDGTKLDGIEAGADVTDATNVSAAGALMESEVTNLAQVKDFDATDYATSAQGTLAASAVQANDSAALKELDLNAIAATISDTAVDVFVYDTSKDSYGGAWRKRTQGTSWYNETLNTATRGSRKEFPAVAVIVAESNQVTIYDGDDPDLPMWMVFNAANLNLVHASNADLSCVLAHNGLLLVGSNGGSSSRLTQIDLITDKGFWYSGTSKYLVNSPIVNRNSGSVVYSLVGTGLVDDLINDVAMTVLPNAPIDPATGLPVPTIAVATGGGVSVIKDDGTVVSLTTSNNPAETVSWLSNNHLAAETGGYPYVFTLSSLPKTVSGYVSAETPSSDFWHHFSLTEYANTYNYVLTGTNGTYGNETVGEYLGSYCDAGFALVDENFENYQNGSSVHVTSTYNTGWMNGDIKLATLSDTDDTDVTGSELVTNGTFASTDISSWSPYQFSTNTTTIAHDTGNGGRLLVTTTAWYAGAMQTITGLTAGKTYTVSANFTAGTLGQFYIQVENTTPGGAVNTVSWGGPYTSLSNSITFTAVAGQTQCRLNIRGTNGSGTFYIEDASIRLAEEDRSVNGNGLQVFGTVTKNPVATGADLVAYSGFSTSNYLHQPYNSGLDFGTGDWCYMWWIKMDGVTNGTAVFGRDAIEEGGTSAGRIGCYFNADKLRVDLTDDGASSYTGKVSSQSVIGLTGWNCFAIIRRGVNFEFYINGNFDSRVALGSTGDGSYTNTSATLNIGYDTNVGAALSSGALALFRASATAPSPEQIKKIYEDEKVLFQENAQATLYGSSDAVTALAYDDATELLHVGTSAGRSVFQGLRRVDNTTDAVGAAISASNGLVAED